MGSDARRAWRKVKRVAAKQPTTIGDDGMGARGAPVIIRRFVAWACDDNVKQP